MSRVKLQDISAEPGWWVGGRNVVACSMTKTRVSAVGDMITYMTSDRDLINYAGMPMYNSQH